MTFFLLSLFAVIFAVGTSPTAQAQSPIDRPKVVIENVELEGTLLPKAVQEQLVNSLKQRVWEEDSNWVADLEIIVSGAETEGWPDRENQGYLGFSVSAWWKPLRREPGLLHVLVTIDVNEGQQKRLDKIEFHHVDHLWPSDLDSNRLRELFPLNDGEIYNRDKYQAGLSAVIDAYAERGFIDCRIDPTIKSDDVNQTVVLVMDITEGEKYRWGNIQVIGLDPTIETALRSRLATGSPVNRKLIRDFYQEYKSLLPVGASPETVKWDRDSQRAIVNLTFDFDTPPLQPVRLR
jgi:outer membrane protein assembly factor BamA